MAIAHDVETVGVAFSTATTQTTSHAASALARSAVVQIHVNGAGNSAISRVTYGGVEMQRIQKDLEESEVGNVYTYFLDGIAGGTQNVAITATSTLNKRAVISTQTCTAGSRVAIEATGSSWAISANPSWNCVTGAGVNTVLYEAIHSGLTTMTNTPATGWTLQNSEDILAQGRGFARRTATGGTVTCGWIAATSDDWVGHAIALKEASAVSGLYVDNSSPQFIFEEDASVTTPAAFTPPADSLIVVEIMYNSGGGETPADPSISDTLGLSWTLQAHNRNPDINTTTNGGVAIWSAAGTGASMNITTTLATVTNPCVGMKTQVWRDTSGNRPVFGQVKKNASSTSQTAVSDSFTAGATGSRSGAAMVSWAATDPGVLAGSGCTLEGGTAGGYSSYIDLAVVLRAANDGASGSSTTLAWTIVTASNDTRWVLYEIEPGVAAPAAGLPALVMAPRVVT